MRPTSWMALKGSQAELGQTTWYPQSERTGSAKIVSTRRGKKKSEGRQQASPPRAMEGKGPDGLRHGGSVQAARDANLLACQVLRIVRRQMAIPAPMPLEAPVTTAT